MSDGQSLSREEAALVKLSEWLSRFNESDEEIVVTRKSRGAIAEFVVIARVACRNRIDRFSSFAANRCYERS
ncbi:MAG TPA: hypothetical protein VHB99_12895 [Pirellulales bacterium]|nr:hypothetical protein [Pirellulales bacterium]